jgi:manganese/zinc/iron transport system permease protein
MATMTGIVFVAVFLLAPEKGILARLRRRARQRWEFARTMLAVHLAQHEHQPQSAFENAAFESRADHLLEHFRWQPAFAEQVIRYAERTGAVRRQGDVLILTDDGRTLAQERMVTT